MALTRETSAEDEQEIGAAPVRGHEGAEQYEVEMVQDARYSAVCRSFQVLVSFVGNPRGQPGTADLVYAGPAVGGERSLAFKLHRGDVVLLGWARERG